MKGLNMMAITRRDALTGGVAAAAALALPVTLPGALAAQRRAAPVWRKLPTVPFRGKQDDIAFVNPDIGWYGNGEGKLYATTDGGNSWTKLWEAPGTFIRSLGFLDARVGFLGNVGTDYYPGVTDAHPLYRTDDGGRTWTPVAADGIDRVHGICGIDICREQRIFQGAMHEVVTVHAAGRVGGPAAVMRSEDGGRSWRVIDLSAQASMILDVKFLTARIGFVACSSPSDTGEGEAMILRTDDGAATWRSVYRSGRAKENVWKMAWPTARTGYGTVQSYDDAPGNTHRVVVKTDDGGRSWREVPLVADAGAQEFGVGFLDAATGFVGTRQRGYATRDGGRSWQPTGLGPAINKIRVVRDGARTRLFAIGVDVWRLDVT